MSANDGQVDGDHYRSSYQHWDFEDDVGLSYKEAQVVKYLTRMKDGVNDTRKAKHFLEKMIEVEHRRVSLATHFSRANNLSPEVEGIIVSIIRGRLHEALDQTRLHLHDQVGEE